MCRCKQESTSPQTSQFAACSRLPLQTQPIPIQSAPLIPLIQNIHIHDVMMRQIKLQSILLHKMKLAEKDGKGWQACTENGRGMLGPTGSMSGLCYKVYWSLFADVLLCSGFTVVLNQETLLSPLTVIANSEFFHCVFLKPFSALNRSLRYHEDPKTAREPSTPRISSGAQKLRQAVGQTNIRDITKCISICILIYI